MRPYTRAELVGDESEAHFMERVRRRARLLGWDDFHVHDSIAMRRGWPDLALMRGETLVLAELKSEHGRLSLPQRDFFRKAQHLRTIEAYVWRPSDERDIWKVLERGVD